MAKPNKLIVTDKKSISEDHKRHETFITNALKGIAGLRNYFDKDSIQMGNTISYGSYHVVSARDYVISGIINEAEKATLSCMQTSSFILDSKEAEEKKTPEEIAKHSEIEAEMPHLRGAIIQSRIDEKTLWERKLTEGLVDLVGFRHTNDESYYRHYALLRERERLTRILSDFKEYHGSNNKNIQHQINEMEKEIDSIVSRIDPDKCWYVDAINSKKGKIRFKVADFRLRLERVSPWMKPSQRLMTGISYGNYSALSANLHPSTVHIKEIKPSMHELDKHFMRVTMLVNEVVFAAMDAKRITNPKGWLGGFAKALKRNEFPAELLAKLTRPDIAVGDFVIAQGDLAEVTKVNRSKIGYRGFRVRYLLTPPIPTIREDEMPARYVKLFTKRQPIVEGVRGLLSAKGDTPPSSRRINSSIRMQVIDMWENMGYKEIWTGKREEGIEKMKIYKQNFRKRFNIRPEKN